MGVSKTNLFTKQQNELALVAKAFAHPARIAILEHLIRAKQCINSDLVDELSLAQATISQHLKELKSVGLIKGTVDGASMCYCINTDVWNRMKGRLQGLMDSYDPIRCC